MGTMPIYPSCFVCLAFLSFLFMFLNKVWWTPVRIQSMMRSQGIKCPSYKFIHGNSKEITNMRTSVVSFPLELSHVHELLPRVQPHIHAWIKLYGRLISSFLFFLPKAPTWWNLTLFFFFFFTYKSCPGMNFLFWQGPQALLVVTEPDLIKQVLNNKNGEFRKRDPTFYI
jgi:PHYB activation tagged suppressor 1